MCLCVNSCLKSSRSANVNEINLDLKRTKTLSSFVAHYEHRRIIFSNLFHSALVLSLSQWIVLHRWVCSFTSAFDSPSSRDHVCECEYMLATRSVASHVHISLLFVPENRNLWSPFHFIFVFHQKKRIRSLTYDVYSLCGVERRGIVSIRRDIVICILCWERSEKLFVTNSSSSELFYMYYEPLATVCGGWQRRFMKWICGGI